MTILSADMPTTNFNSDRPFKTCIDLCGRTFFLDEMMFHRDYGAKDGYKNRCTNCVQKNYYEAKEKGVPWIGHTRTALAKPDVIDTLISDIYSLSEVERILLVTRLFGENQWEYTK